ncbi:uncharacterized protein LAESUDRAFT_298550 [Laetiporus sulphureus 93-53]|uniref:Uncharacterized protein n=1 Tax=Laetiporus sulphureus 93-53 TaxID=1314785 RepID=A0A165DBT7_9APHY|nr:uncharacterized protein LAESUDRAFT_298550 [Laetiporus sulphureus 93-53]KZT04512.1 hypothetical protein LAESUDRAFT_298550 [Laetiporus sulphureus 93-53]
MKQRGRRPLVLVIVQLQSRLGLRVDLTENNCGCCSWTNIRGRLFLASYYRGLHGISRELELLSLMMPQEISHLQTPMHDDQRPNQNNSALEQTITH